MYSSKDFISFGRYILHIHIDITLPLLLLLPRLMFHLLLLSCPTTTSFAYLLHRFSLSPPLLSLSTASLSTFYSITITLIYSPILYHFSLFLSFQWRWWLRSLAGFGFRARKFGDFRHFPKRASFHFRTI
jgi:hypothetical protein